MSSSPADLWDAIAEEAAAESPLWSAALLPRLERQLEPVFSRLGESRFALGLETIYEGYLLHYGRPRLFGPPDDNTALLLGDYLYAHGLVRIADLGEVAAVSDLAELISLCAQLRALELEGDGAAWSATAALMGAGALEDARDSLRAHRDPRPLEELARAFAGEQAVAAATAAHALRVR